jgi:pseudouridine synthase
LQKERKFTYIVFNKPYGVLCQFTDQLGRKTLKDYIHFKGVYSIGRLDMDTEGLLLLTNDGDLAYVLSHPRFSISKTYLVKVAGVPDDKKLARLKRGVMLEDGRAKAVSCSLLHEREKNSWVRIVVTEGRNRLVKRMFSAIGHSVLKLKRVEYGPIRLGDLPFGQSRYLTLEEVQKLKQVRSELVAPPFIGGESIRRQ